MLHQSNKINRFFLYLFLTILCLLPTFSSNHSLVHGFNQHPQRQYFSSDQKPQFLDIDNSHSQHWHFCLLCSFWQQNKISATFCFFATFLAFVLCFFIDKKHFFSFTSVVCNFFKTGPPCLV